MSKTDIVTYLKNIFESLKMIEESKNKIMNRLDVIDIEIKQLKENSKIQDNKIDKILTSCEKRKSGVTINNNVEVDLSDRQVSGKCKYTDEQLYCMHYNIGNRFKKAYSINDLINITGMSGTYIKRKIKDYKNRMSLED